MLSRPTMDALGFNRAARRVHGNRRINVVGDWSDVFGNLGDTFTKALDQAAPALVNEALGLPKQTTVPSGTKYTTTANGQIVNMSGGVSPPMTNWLVPIAIGGVLLFFLMKK